MKLSFVVDATSYKTSFLITLIKEKIKLRQIEFLEIKIEMHEFEKIKLRGCLTFKMDSVIIEYKIYVC